MNLLAELRRRSVFRVAAAYLISGWVVMQVVALIASASGLPEWTTSFVLMLVIAGLPIALIIAWAFEITPEGVKQTETDGDAARVRPFSLSDGILLAALAGVMGLIGWQQFAAPATIVVEVPALLEEAANVEVALGPEAASIAVLAFADLSPGGDQEYFSDGISEELLNVLVRVEGLRVASRTSAFRFKGSNASIPEIAADLHVRHVLEGSVRRAGETVRITAQLIDSQTDEHLWSETYDRELTTSNLFEVQDDIATAIVAALSEQLQGILPMTEIEVENTTTNLTAYELFLRARQLYIDRRNLGEVERLLAQAVELDPEYADAWELRGANYMLVVWNYGGIPGTNEELLATAREYIGVALRLDPDSSLALAVNANISATFDSDPSATIIAQSIEDLTRALELDAHNVSALNWRGSLYMTVGYLQLALDDFLACTELEPLSAACQANVRITYSWLGEDQLVYDNLISSLEQGATYLSPPYASIARLGMRDLFLILLAQEDIGSAPWGTPDVWYEILRNPTGDFDYLIPAFEAQWDEHIEYKYFGPIIGAYPADYEGGWFPFFGAEYARYRQSTEYQELLHASPLAEFWRTNGFPPNCRTRDDGWIECD